MPVRRGHASPASRLIGIALKILRDRAAAQDAVQVAFVAVWQRGRAVLRDDPALGDSPVFDDPLEAMGAAADATRLRACRAALEENNRRSIILAFVDGLRHAQVAEKLALPLGTVKAWPPSWRCAHTRCNTRDRHGARPVLPGGGRLVGFAHRAQGA